MAFETLEQLSAKRFPTKSDAESKLLRRSQNGDLMPSLETVRGNNDLAKADHWDNTRTIRASFIHWLCTNQDARKFIDSRGIQTFGAKIEGELILSYVKLPFPLSFWCCRFMTYVEMRCLEVPELDLQGSWVEFLEADRMKVTGNFFLRYGNVNRCLSIAGAQIGGDLALTGCALSKAQAKGSIAPKNVALNADRVVIHGAAFLREGFSANGDVRFPGAQIGCELDCSNATFLGNVNLNEAVINGAFIWTGIKAPAMTSLSLSDARLSSIRDDKNSWPPKGHLWLDGLTYRDFSTNSTKDYNQAAVSDRIDWLSRAASFSPQPYEQLAQVFRDHGDAEGSRRILVEMERRLRGRAWYDKPESAVLDSAIGYGYYPGNAIWGAR